MPALGIWLHCSRGPRDLDALEASINRLSDVAGVVPKHISIRSTRVRSRVYKPPRLHEDIAHPGSFAITLATLDQERIDGLLQSYYLRPVEPTDADRFICSVKIVSTALPVILTQDLLGVLAQLAQLATNYVIEHGCVAGFSTPARAGLELFHGAYSPVGEDPALCARVHEDEMSQRQLATKLRRLYPVTIIGKAIWDTLPPLPNVTPAVSVTDIADCKLLVAWPELVEPRDPAFLAGTRELRRWLWPYTIQNPADALERDEE